MKKKIGIIGQFPPPIHGLSKALDTLCNSKLNGKYKLYKFNITNNYKFIYVLFRLLVSNLNVYYLTISQSKYGNLRDLIIIKIIQLKRKKIIIHLHGGGFRNLLDNEVCGAQRKLNYVIFKKIDRIIVLGESLKYIFKGIVDDEKISIVRNCVDNQYIIDKYDFENKMTLLKNKSVIKILYLSNFIEDKGYKYVLELAKYTYNISDNRFKFIFAGKFFSKTEKEDFFKYINRNNLDGFVEYKGIVNGESKIDVFKECDFYILLTKYKNEGQPISIIEAAANGLYIITTNHAGISDILNKDNMFSIDKNKIVIKSIYEKIIELWMDKNKMIDLVIKNRKEIIRKHSEREYINSIDKIFSRI